MANHFSLRNIAVVAASGLVAALFASGTAQAITDTIFKYSTAQTGYLVIPAGAFTPQRSGISYINTGDLLSPSSTDQVCFTGPVNLPNGAKMTTLTVWYQRGAFDEFPFVLLRAKLADGAVETIINTVLANTNGVRKGVNLPIATLQTVDNLHYAYLIRMCLENSLVPTFYSARFTYTYTNAGD
jgi:hypothetical protein